MPREDPDPHRGLSLPEARQHVIDAVLATRGSLHDPAFANFIQPDQDISFAELEIDSLTAIEFCLEIEDRTGIEIDPGDLVSNPSVNALSAMLTSKQAKNT